MTHTPEQAFLVACGRPSRQALASMADPQGLDWVAVFDAARRHAMTSLVCHAIDRGEGGGRQEGGDRRGDRKQDTGDLRGGRTLQPGDRSPATGRGPEMSDVARRFRALFERNAAFASQLLDLLEAFEAKGVPAVPLKGPVMAVELYGSLGLRESVDLDFLIPEAAVRRAAIVLEQQGYRPDGLPTARHQRAFIAAEHASRFTCPDAAAPVELHWRFAPRAFAADVDLEAMWTRLRPMEFGGRELMVLRPEDLLVFLCVHGARHLWDRLRWIVDVAALLDAYPTLDWGQVARTAKASGSSRMLHVGVGLAHELLGAPLPERVASEIDRDRRADALIAWFAAHLFAHRRPAGPWRLHFKQLEMKDRIGDRVRFAWRVMTTPNAEDWAQVSLPRALTGAYRVLRPIRLLARYARRPIRRPEAGQIYQAARGLGLR